MNRLTKCAFGILFEKVISLQNAFVYPITSVMPSLAFPDGNLKQSNKSNLRTLEYRIIGGVGIIGGVEISPKTSNRGAWNNWGEGG